MENLKEIVARVFDIDKNEVNDELSRYAEEWDSFNHLLLISEIEMEMEIKLTLQEIEQINTFKELREIVSKRWQNE